MTFKFSSGKVIETGDAYDSKVTGTKFNVTGDAWGHVVFHVARQEGKGPRDESDEQARGSDEERSRREDERNDS